MDMLTIQEAAKQDVQEGRQSDQPKQHDSDKNRKQKTTAERHTVAKPKQKTKKKGLFSWFK
jgi:hypothetical protein